MSSFITTPTHEWLEKHLPKCRKRFLVASPYVGDYLPLIARHLQSSVSRVLLTRTDLRDFAQGASDIDAVCETARLGAKVFSLPRLHAKVYVIDNNAALVTSANATRSGMHRNWECGVSIVDETEVNDVAGKLLSGFGSRERPQQWTLSDLERLREPILALRDSLPPTRRVSRSDSEEHETIVLPEQGWQGLIAGLHGWARLVLEGVISQADDQFHLRDVNRTCLPMAAKRFPANKFPREKIRQQLQRLRDLGVIEFLGNGQYKRTIQPKK